MHWHFWPSLKAVNFLEVKGNKFHKMCFCGFGHGRFKRSRLLKLILDTRSVCYSFSTFISSVLWRWVDSRWNIAKMWTCLCGLLGFRSVGCRRRQLQLSYRRPTEQVRCVHYSSALGHWYDWCVRTLDSAVHGHRRVHVSERTCLNAVCSYTSHGVSFRNPPSVKQKTQISLRCRSLVWHRPNFGFITLGWIECKKCGLLQSIFP